MKGGRFILFFVAMLFLSACGHKKLIYAAFEMDLPSGWSYERLAGNDTAGTITTPTSTLTFNYSVNGKANSLTQTEAEFVAQQTNWALSDCYFCKPGVTYVPARDVYLEKRHRMEKAGIKDTSLIKVEPDIVYTKKILKADDKWKHFYMGVDYIAELKYKDSVINIPIYIPKEIKLENIKVDSNKNYVIKTVWSKESGDGVTGVYYRSKKSNLTLSIAGTDLNQDEQQHALAAFKTIKIKE